MRHADGDFPHTGGGGGFDDRVQRGDGDLTPLQPEALRGDVALLAERLEPLGFRQLLQHLALLARVHGVQPRCAFDLALDPGLLFGVLDVHELDADRAAIGVAEDADDFAKGGGFAAQHVIDEDRAVHVGFGEAVRAGIEFRMRRGNLQAERIEARFQMAPHAVGADQHQRADRRNGGGAHLFVGHHAGGYGGGGPRVRGGGTRLGLFPRRPGGAGGFLQHRACLIVQGREQVGEAGIDRGGIYRPAGVLFAQECRVCPAEGGCQDINASHVVPRVAEARSLTEGRLIPIVQCSIARVASLSWRRPGHAVSPRPDGPWRL